MLEQHLRCVLRIEFPEAASDSDTPQDVSDFSSRDLRRVFVCMKYELPLMLNNGGGVILLAIAETGGNRSASAHLASLEEISRRASAAGMDLMNATLQRVIQGNAKPDRLLPAAYLCTLFQRQATN